MATKMTKKNIDFITHFEEHIIPMLNYQEIDKVMEYLKISEIANKCEVINMQIFEYYRLLGANKQLSKENDDIIYSTIENLKKDLQKAELRLKKLVN